MIVLLYLYWTNFFTACSLCPRMTIDSYPQPKNIPLLLTCPPPTAASGAATDLRVYGHYGGAVSCKQSRENIILGIKHWHRCVWSEHFGSPASVWVQNAWGLLQVKGHQIWPPSFLYLFYIHLLSSVVSEFPFGSVLFVKNRHFVFLFHMNLWVVSKHEHCWENHTLLGTRFGTPSLISSLASPLWYPFLTRYIDRYSLLSPHCKK